MREKLQEEQRREAAAEAAAAAAAAASEALNVPTPPVPLHHALQGIDLPQQVLQVKWNTSPFPGFISFARI